MSQRTVNPRRPHPAPHLAALEPLTPAIPLAGFAEFGVSKPVVDALRMRGITGAFAIQELVLRDAIAGRDVLARSRTGSGKTLAFAMDGLRSGTQDPWRARAKGLRNPVIDHSARTLGRLPETPSVLPSP